MKSVCIAAQFPPPVHGLSKAVETLYRSRLNGKYRFSKIDITDNRRLLQVLRLLLRCRNDVVYFTLSQSRWGNLRDLLLLSVIRWRRKPCVVHLHGGYYRQLVDSVLPGWQRSLNYRTMRHLAGGIVLGESLRRIFTGMMPEERIFVCPNCVDDAFVASSIEGKLKEMAGSETLHLLYLSNFIRTKGYREVLELAAMAQERGDAGRFVFHFAGKFFDAEEERYFREHSVGLDNVVFHGVVSGEAKAELLRRCHVFLLLTRYPSEGQPISILEAMGNGLSVVTTDHAGIPEIVSQDNGLVCKREHIDVERIYRYLRTCWQDRQGLASVCRRNFRTAGERYTERQYIDNMDRILETVCSR